MNRPTGKHKRPKPGSPPWSFCAKFVMATILLPNEFRELLKSLNTHLAEYLLIGGFAVGYYGYPRATGDMDIWFDQTPTNAQRISDALVTFGFNQADVPATLFLEPGSMFRMGNPPLRIELLTDVSGIHFAGCWPRREVIELDGIPVNIIDIQSLKANKQASGRLKDLNDLENLP